VKDPAIHIKRSDLIKIFTELELPIDKVNILLKKALPLTLRNRIIVTSNSKSKKKIERLLDTEVNMEQFTRIYTNVMVMRNIKSMLIRKGDPQYISFKEVATQAKDFCDLFELDYEEGLRQYIECGVDLLGVKYSLYRIKAYAGRIVDYYKDLLLISEDPNPEGTKKMFNAWVKAVHKYYGSHIDTGKNVAVYAHFIHARNDADSIGANYSHWMYAQFEKWAYLNSIPEFSQLHGENAKLIYNLYIAKLGGEGSYLTKVKDEKEIPLKSTKQKAIRGKEDI